MGNQIHLPCKPFILFCAGEDSGDILGEPCILETSAAGMLACGAGGPRMQRSGLLPLVDYSHLPVSGFGDVLSKFLQLKRDFSILRKALCSKNCVALVAIDYPGYNMKLVRLAKRLDKPVLYIAPPQVWAWKSRRAQKLRGIPLAAFFDFELDAYKKNGCEVSLVQHPFVSAEISQPVSQNPEILFLPGSRFAQAARNVRCFIQSILNELPQGAYVTIMAARLELLAPFQKLVGSLLPQDLLDCIRIEVAPQSSDERMRRYASALSAFACPGTATLEIALSGIPLVICTKPDALTYFLGKMLIRSKVFGLPNLVAGNVVCPEVIVAPFTNKAEVQKRVAAAYNAACNATAACAEPAACNAAYNAAYNAAAEKKASASDVAGALLQKLRGKEPLRKLMLEFLGKLV